jgi:hypothetical protein
VHSKGYIFKLKCIREEEGSSEQSGRSVDRLLTLSYLKVFITVYNGIMALISVHWIQILVL